jgi:large subunit ribosomal protein L25
METVDITIERRSVQGKGGARRLRAEGRVPAILYGPKRQAAQVTISQEEVEKKLATLEGSHLIRLLHGGADGDLHERMVLVREMQRHPVSGRVLHADFYEVDLTERLTVSVPLRLIGKAEGVVAGGILQPILREVEVECLPTEIPEFIEIDVTPLGIHDAVHVADLVLPEGISAAGDTTRTVVTVLPPTVDARPAEEGAPVAGAEGAPAEGAAEGASKAAPEGAGVKGKGKE